MKLKIKHTKLILKIVNCIWGALIIFITITQIVPLFVNDKKSKSINIYEINRDILITEKSLEFDLENLKQKNIEEELLNEPYYFLDEEDKEMIIAIVAGEAKGEDYEGKLAVAQCILDNLIYENTTIENIKWKFDGYDSELKKENEEAWDECKKAVEAVFDKGERVINEPLLWFYNRKTTYSSFHEEKTKYVGDWGNHSFFTLK